MLVISRREGETIKIGKSIIFEIVSVRGGQVKLAIKELKDFQILRDDAKKKKK